MSDPAPIPWHRAGYTMAGQILVRDKDGGPHWATHWAGRSRGGDRYTLPDGSLMRRVGAELVEITTGERYAVEKG